MYVCFYTKICVCVAYKDIICYVNFSSVQKCLPSFLITKEWSLCLFGIMGFN